MAKSTKKVDPLTVTPPLQDMPADEGKSARLQRLYDSWFRCGRCFLSRQRSTDDIVFAHGNPDSGIMIVGEAPGEEEERTLMPFVGQSGRLLNRILAMNSDDPRIQTISKNFERGKSTKAETESFFEELLTWRKDNFFVTNVVSCRPPENRPPIKEELDRCWERLWNMIYIVDPLVIVAVGKTAAMTVIQAGKFELMARRGEVFDARYHGVVGEVRYPVVPVLHPSFLLRTADWKEPDGFWAKSMRDWKKVFYVLDQQRFQHLKIPMPLRGY